MSLLQWSGGFSGCLNHINPLRVFPLHFVTFCFQQYTNSWLSQGKEHFFLWFSIFPFQFSAFPLSLFFNLHKETGGWKTSYSWTCWWVRKVGQINPTNQLPTRLPFLSDTVSLPCVAPLSALLLLNFKLMHSVFTYFISSLWKSLFDRYRTFVIMHHMYYFPLCLRLTSFDHLCRASTAALWRQEYTKGWVGRVGDRRMTLNENGDLSSQKPRHVDSSTWMSKITI